MMKATTVIRFISAVTIGYAVGKGLAISPYWLTVATVMSGWALFWCYTWDEAVKITEENRKSWQRDLAEIKKAHEEYEAFKDKPDPLWANEK